MKRKIIFVTGARSEYDIMYPVLCQLKNINIIDLKLVVTGSHLSDKFGKSIVNIENDGFVVCEKIYNLISSNEKISRILSLSNQISVLAHTLNREKPDIVVVVGDREEAISVTLTCAYLSIPVAHLAGGDVANDGNIDNAVRYAASKFSNIHFPFLKQHADVLKKLGEEDFRIYCHGNPALDKFINSEFIERSKLKILDNFISEDEPYLILIQHPIITESDSTFNQIKETLEGILKSNYKCFINYPNSDPGNHDIIIQINEYARIHPNRFKVFKNLDRVTFINLLRHASCLVGNSSSGIIEAPSIFLPVVNVGTRQRDRVSAGNVIYVDYNSRLVNDAIIKSVTDLDYRSNLKTLKNPYGDGNSAYKIANTLSEIEINDQLIYKNITYKLSNIY
jgi:GDP/UDP-N,N'-diacetylbacillosamine 2-epimerase (hydrolysing)